MRLGTPLTLLVAASMFASCASLAAPATTYENNFDDAAVGQVPDGFVVINGEFTVAEDGGNKFLELPGAPLDSFGVLFGPAATDGASVTARFFGTSKGRRHPAFGVGLGGVSGFKLQVTPAKKAVELYLGDLVVASAAWEWRSGQWTHLRLQIRKAAASSWVVEGRVWAEGQAEPSDWAIRFEPKDPPISGKAGVWGKPFADTPIRFDDVKVTPTHP